MYCGNWVCGLLVIQGLWIHISNKQSNRITAHRRWKLAYITSSSHLLYLGIVSWRGNNVALKYGTRLLVACNWDHDNLLNCIICLAYLLESTIHISKKQNSSVVSKWRFFDRFLFYYSFVIVFFLKQVGNVADTPLWTLFSCSFSVFQFLRFISFKFCIQRV